MGLADRKEEFDRAGVRVVAVAIASREKLRALQEQLGDGAILVADTDGQATRAFGLLDPSPFPLGPLAQAGSFWIDRDGVVRARWLAENYRERPGAEEILSKIRSGL